MTRKAILAGATAGLVLLIALAASGVGRAHVLINESPSLPRGLYLRWGERIERGSIVAVGQPVEVMAYLARLGMPAEVLLLKRVAAAGGDTVCVEGGVLQTPGRRVSTRAHDGQGEALRVWEGCRSLEPDELFLLGDTPGSFDSRYFGPVKRGAAKGNYREILTW
jgi:conjugative transfer signal peptidase TraF